MQLSVYVLVTNLIATAYMVGLIWMVQVVHYPLFAKVGTEHYNEYQKSHQILTSLVVGPPMLVELGTAMLLVWLKPVAVPAWSVWLALGLLAVIWASTALLQVPCHEKLTSGFDADVHRRLVATNWIRTIAWSARAGLLTWMLVQVLSLLLSKPLAG